MTYKTLMLGIATLISLAATAQDKIYKTDGSIIDARVKTIDVTTINYKRFANPDGPEYSILKIEVAKIIYQNGTIDVFGKNAAPANGRSSAKRGGKKEKFLKRFGSNIITVIPAGYTTALIDGTINDPGIGICYERQLDERGHISFCLPVMLNFVQNNDFNSNFFYGSTYISGGSGSYSSYLFMPGVKFYPADAAQRVRYGLGVSLFALFGNEPYAVYNDNNPGYSSYVPTGDWHYTMYGLMISNSLNVSVSKHFYMEFDINGGIPFSDNRRADNSAIDNIVAPIMQFTLKTGYRF